eukprot:1410397-Prymnesium_polylepis.1
MSRAAPMPFLGHRVCSRHIAATCAGSWSLTLYRSKLGSARQSPFSSIRTASARPSRPGRCPCSRPPRAAPTPPRTARSAS